MTRVWLGVFLILNSVFFCGAAYAYSDQYRTAVQAYYQKDYPKAQLTLQSAPENTTDTGRLLQSLIFLKTSQVASANTLFSQIDLSALALGHYRSVLKLQFYLAMPSFNALVLHNTLQTASPQIGTNPLYTELSLQVATKLKAAQHIPLATALFQSIVADGEPAAQKKALLELFDIGIASRDAQLSTTAVSKLLRTDFPVIRLERMLFKLNQTFVTSHNFNSLLGGGEAYLNFFRRLYNAQDYDPVRVYGGQFLYYYPSHNAALEVRTNMAMCHFLQKNYTASIPSLDAIIQTAPSQSYWRTKAMFYKARSLQRLKQIPEAQQIFETIIAQDKHPELVSDACYYLYWCYEAQDNIAGFATYYLSTKPPIESSAMLDQLIWNIAWDMYKSGRTKDAYSLLLRHPLGRSSDDFKAKVLFWLGKMALEFDKEKSQFYFKKCCLRYPLSVYTSRIIQLYLPEEKEKIRARIKSTPLATDMFYIKLANLGLGERVVLDIEGQLSQNKGSNRKSLGYTLSKIYQQSGDHYRSVTTLSKSGITSVQQGDISRDILEMYYPKPHWDAIVAASNDNHIDPFLAISLLREESLFNSQARSRTGALGLMQIMPTTGMGIAKNLNIPWDGPEILLNPETNIIFGTWYLGSLKKSFDNNFVHMLSGYNAGPNATQKWKLALENQEPDFFMASIPYKETNNYVAKVLKSYHVYRLLYQ